ncbi:STAS/SEC14 domain-containing protein [Nocardia sp. NPDC050710]|uniref:STAS/SEC14 domain-containing protein n=1 Tax=Nocardia sp. NPDC050710 TaxID=3157220 RepID=UPI003407C421
MSIETISKLPAGVLGFRGSGVITADDYRTVLDPEIKKAVDARRRINLVYVLGADFDRYSLGAMWQDTLLATVPHKEWGRIALVTDHRALGEAVHLLAFMLPGEVKVFAAAQETDAIEWVSHFPDSTAA